MGYSSYLKGLLNGIGIDVYKVEAFKCYKNTINIFDEIGNKWDQLSLFTKNKLSEALLGIEQQNN